MFLVTNPIGCAGGKGKGSRFTKKEKKWKDQTLNSIVLKNSRMQLFEEKDWKILFCLPFGVHADVVWDRRYRQLKKVLILKQVTEFLRWISLSLSSSSICGFCQ